MSWVSLPCDCAELKLEVVLMCGQSFRWRQTEDGTFRSVLGGKVISLRQDKKNLYYKIHHHDEDSVDERTQNEDSHVQQKKIEKKSESESESESDNNKQDQKRTEQMLKDYFQLEISTANLHKNWSKNDDNFRGLYKRYSGVRVLRQDPVENLFSFICSSNNNISRITSMIEQLTVHFGKKVMTLDSVNYYEFPEVDLLAKDDVEARLRELGFGYRAKFVVKSAQYICDHGGGEWLYTLREKSYDEAKGELLKLCGVGEKVADCVLLMSLDKRNAIPIDTHIAAVARQSYLPNLPNNKTITAAVYKQIGDHLRGLWGEYAGWAQAVVFSADLPKFKEVAQKKKAVKRKRPVT